MIESDSRAPIEVLINIVDSITAIVYELQLMKGWHFISYTNWEAGESNRKKKPLTDLSLKQLSFNKKTTLRKLSPHLDSARPQSFNLNDLMNN